MSGTYKGAEAALGGAPAEDKAAEKSPSAKKPEMHVCEISIRKGFAGGYIVKHQLECEDGGCETHEYPLASMKDLQKHLEEHLGEVVADPDEADEAKAE